ncbi:MAG: hypothetical protein K8T25_14295, partial [Planctomycetia bacterium]|nr:hypothetical protein [Planctomycetia bacterium]
MSGEIIIPELGESIHDVRVARWFKQAGEIVKQDDDLVEIESEKATVVLPAPQAGRLASVLVETGAEAKVGQVIGQIEAVAQASQPEKKAQPETKAQPEKEASSPSAPAAQPAPAENFHPAGPDVRRALREHGLTEAQVAAEEPPGARLTRTSVEQYVRRHAEAEPAAPPTLAPPPPLAVVPTVIAPSSVARDRPEEVV